jgi:hypothetical protein
VIYKVRPQKTKRENKLEIWFVSFIGGFVGSMFMDITETKMAKVGISSGVTGAYVGRWVSGLMKGILLHKNITTTASVENEIRLGQVFHFIVGGGVVALFYPAFLELITFNEPLNHLLSATVFGLATSVLPWFVLMPSFGWGVFGSKAPEGARPIISPVLSHIPYGFGIGLTLVVYYTIMA